MFCRLAVIGRCILIDFVRFILCFCDHCVRLRAVFFIVCLVFSAFFDVLCYVNLRLYITSVRCVLQFLLRLIFCGVRVAVFHSSSIFRVSLQLFCEIFFMLRSTERDMIEYVCCSSCKVPVILVKL